MSRSSTRKRSRAQKNAVATDPGPYAIAPQRPNQVVFTIEPYGSGFTPGPKWSVLAPLNDMQAFKAIGDFSDSYRDRFERAVADLGVTEDEISQLAPEAIRIAAASRIVVHLRRGRLAVDVLTGRPGKSGNATELIDLVVIGAVADRMSGVRTTFTTGLVGSLTGRA